jgi:methyl-accepting chemotaxis protein
MGLRHFWDRQSFRLKILSAAAAMGTAPLIYIALAKVGGGVLLGCLALLLGGLGLLNWYMARMFRPVKGIREGIEDVVQSGDYRLRMDKPADRELGALFEAFRKLLEHFRKIPQSLGGGVDMLAQAVAEIEASIAQQDQHVARQATALAETMTTATEIKQMSLKAAENAERVSEYMRGSRALAADGRKSVENSMSHLNAIREEVHAIGERIAVLEKSTSQIEFIADTVKDLAEQSNMLALNASIEAIRSGEHGKGFGLVAREIRRLSDESRRATQRVHEILGGVSRATQEVVRAAAEGNEKVEKGLLDAQQGGEAFDQMAAVVQKSADEVEEIAAAVGQQKVGIDQVFQAIADQNKMMEETTQRLDRTRGATQSLTVVAQLVRSIAAQFKRDPARATASPR